MKKQYIEVSFYVSFSKSLLSFCYNDLILLKNFSIRTTELETTLKIKIKLTQNKIFIKEIVLHLQVNFNYQYFSQTFY